MLSQVLMIPAIQSVVGGSSGTKFSYEECQTTPVGTSESHHMWCNDRKT